MKKRAVLIDYEPQEMGPEVIGVLELTTGTLCEKFYPNDEPYKLQQVMETYTIVNKIPVGDSMWRVYYENNTLR